MIGRRTLGTFGSLVTAALGIAWPLTGCSGAAGGSAGDPQQEKVAATSQALIVTDSTTPYTFPTANAKPQDCSVVAPTQLLNHGWAGSPSWTYAENYYAYPVTDGSDPYHTQYSHYYSYEESKQGTLAAQLATDFFSIPNGNGYKYNVAQISQTAINEGGNKFLYTLTQSTQFYYLEGIGRVDTGWLMYPPTSTTNPPWCVLGNCTAGQAHFDSNSHPPYGSNATSADWGQLWNLAWTYSYGPPQDGPPDGGTDGGTQGPNNPATKTIASTHHQCAFVYVCPGGQECSNDPSYPVGCPSGQSCISDINDPGEHCGAPCWNPSTLSAFESDGVTFYNPNGLVTQDFLVAAERHDPYGPFW